jgi:hypothetical protein
MGKETAYQPLRLEQQPEGYVLFGKETFYTYTGVVTLQERDKHQQAIYTTTALDTTTTEGDS